MMNNNQLDDDNSNDVPISNDGKQPEWKNSEARNFLYGLLIRNELPGRLDITPREVFDNYCKNRLEFRLFQDYQALNFANKLRNLRDKVEVKSTRASEDAQFLAHDRLIFPPSTEDTKAQPWWPESEAQALLRQDINDKKHENLRPKELYETREEYYSNYSLDFFRNKIYQEIKAKKREAWINDKAEKKKNKEEGR